MRACGARGKHHTQMEYFNSLNSDTIDKVSTQLDEVKGIMVENINKLLDRGEQLEVMVDKTTKASVAICVLLSLARSLCGFSRASVVHAPVSVCFCPWR